MDIRQELNEIFGGIIKGRKKQPQGYPRPIVNDAVKRLSASRLPKDLLQFALNALEKRHNSGYTSTVVHRPDVKKATPKLLDAEHKNGWWWVEQYDEYIGDYYPEFGDKNVRLLEDKLLYQVYDPEDYRLRGTCWFSFKDKMIYRWISYEAPYFGFYKKDQKTIIKPMPYKIWMRQLPDRWQGV